VPIAAVEEVGDHDHLAATRSRPLERAERADEVGIGAGSILAPRNVVQPRQGRHQRGARRARTEPGDSITTRNHHTELVAVPRGAVERESGQSYVFVVISRVGKTMLEKRPIQVGIADATNFEVMSGLQAGEVVALPGDVDLKDGMAVKVVNMDMSNIKGEKNAGLF